ncbi:MAG: HAD family hydrolase [Verrucomicrobiales bacterium]
MSLRALIFDFDGLIVDTESAIYDAWREVYDDHGHELDLSTYADCVGSDHGQFDPMQHLDTLVGRRLDWDTLEPRKEARIRELLEDQQALPGVRELLTAAAGEDLACAVASSSSLSWVGGWLDKLELDHHFEIVRTRDHVERIKPHPDLFLAAAEGLSVPPANAVVFEDSENGLRAAQAAGIHCVAVPNQITSAGTFPGAAMRLDSLADLELDSIRGLFEDPSGT